MSGTLTVLNLAGYVALLLWGVHMASSGLTRAFGSDLRRVLARSLKHRLCAFLVGIGITAALQSSTATGLMATSFVASGMIGLGPALGVMLGANVGTTLIVQVLSFDISLIAPIMVLCGVVAFRRGGRTRTRDLGRVGVGLGLIILALHLLLATIEPLAGRPASRIVFGLIAEAPVFGIVIGTALAWAAHSSVAVVLLVMSLAATGAVDAFSSVALVLGANLGSAINPVLEGTSGSSPAHRRLPTGNLLNRALGIAIVLPTLGWVTEALVALDPDPVRLAANFHTAFNLALALPFLAALPAVERLLERLLPDKPIVPIQPGAPVHLDNSALSDAHLALANASRETLRMADIVETMLRGTVDAFQLDDRKLVSEISRMDDSVDALHRSIKLYLIRISRDGFDDEASRRYSDIFSFAINLENIGDVIDKNLMDLAAKKIRLQLSFSEEGTQDIRQICERLLANLKLAAAVFVTGDVGAAANLVAEKDGFRELERHATEMHLARLREHRLESIETSSLHLDILRDARRINSFIVSAGYSVIDAADGRCSLGEQARQGDLSNTPAKLPSVTR
ncbi:phosphate:Na+ symporter [Inquilinus ginsengisoli]|uniref:Na/Pi cotransporter family protein n=1 Tax=Inquilinus ginsengisoli TaxID=363840 RepID=UPI003D19AF17